jgi:glycosyltransferase involved in cell wall biosynthesis
MILDAAAALPSIHWLLVGDGPLRGELEARVRRDGLGERVHFAGLQADAAQYYGAIDLFVLTSLWEGLPLTLIEAAMGGVPVIAARVGGVAELLPPSPAGYSFPAGDGEAFMQALRDWQEAIPASKRAAIANRPGVLEGFSIDRMLEETLRLYGPEEASPA